MLKQRGIFFSTDAFFGLIIVFMGIAMITSFFVLPTGNDDLITMERLARDAARSQTNISTFNEIVFVNDEHATAQTQINVDHFTCFGGFDYTDCTSFTGSLCDVPTGSKTGLCQLNMEYNTNLITETHYNAILVNSDKKVKVHLP